MASNNDSKSSKLPSKGFTGPHRIVVRGLKVLVSELRWQLTSFIRSLEIKQMNKRLKREYQTLGKAVYEPVKQTPEGESLPPANKKMITAAKQIEFLKDEMANLKQERSRMRKELVYSRSKDLGFEK